MSQEYRAYAIRQLQIAMEKDADAPMSAQMHEEQAAYALKVQRIPEPRETLANMAVEIVESLPCRRCFGTGYVPSETCDDCVDCQDVCPECKGSGRLRVQEAASPA